MPEKVRRVSNCPAGVMLQGLQLFEQARREEDMKKAVRRYEAQRGVQFWPEQMWELARTQPAGWLCLHPRQFMPLCECTGDLHCTAEHFVGTTKHGVRELLLDMDLSDPALWKGKTLQDLIEQVVRARGTGERGRKHIGRSVEKWPHVAAILAAEKTETLQLRYTFGDGGSNESGGKREVHEVKGTAGEWIRDTKWT